MSNWRAFMVVSIYRSMAQNAIKNVTENFDGNANIEALIDAAYPFASRHESLLRIWNEEKRKVLPQLSQQITPIVSEQMPLWS